MPRRLASLAVLVFAIAPLNGCGDSPDGGPDSDGSTRTEKASAPAGAAAASCKAHPSAAEDLRATGIPCGQARRALRGWKRERSCSLPADASRGSCAIRSYRCLATRTDRGIAVSCARAGQSLAFTVRRR